MNDSSSGFGDESPVLFKHQLCGIDSNDLNLDKLYKDLLLHLKKTKSISQKELKLYLEQVTKLSPSSPKHRWLVQKIRGLLKYILKKRAAFHDCVVKGEIIIYEKSIFGEKSVSVASTPVHASSNSTFDVPSIILTNNNFEAMDTNYSQSYNYSQDLFNTATENLHNYGKENFEMFKELTSQSETDDNLFKTPVICDTKIHKINQMHQTLEEKYNSLLSLTPSISQVVDVTLNESRNLEENITEKEFALEHQMDTMNLTAEHLDIGIFDTEEINTDLMNQDFEKEWQETKRYVQEIVLNLLRLKEKGMRKSPKILDSENNTILNDSVGTTDSTYIKTYHSEENFKTIKETCAKFRKKLELKKDLDFLQEYLNSSS